jgi:hypothetical protein
MTEKTPFPFEDVDRSLWPPLRKPRKKRVRKPTLRGVLAQAARAGVSVASFEVAPDGRIVIVPGQPPFRNGESSVALASKWD